MVVQVQILPQPFSSHVTLSEQLLCALISSSVNRDISTLLKAQPITVCQVLRIGLGTETFQQVFAVILVMLKLDHSCMELGGSPQGGDGSRVLV